MELLFFAMLQVALGQGIHGSVSVLRIYIHLTKTYIYIYIYIDICVFIYSFLFLYVCPKTLLDFCIKYLKPVFLNFDQNWHSYWLILTNTDTDWYWQIDTDRYWQILTVWEWQKVTDTEILEWEVTNPLTFPHWHVTITVRYWYWQFTVESQYKIVRISLPTGMAKMYLTIELSVSYSHC